MIKNDRSLLRAYLGLALLLALPLVGGCNRSETPPGYAGIVEYDERLLAFEVGGRVDERPVERGESIAQGELVAELDDSLQRASREVQEQELRVARANAGLVQAGPKESDLWSLGSRIEAARAVEKGLETNLERERTLHERGVTPEAVVDDLERQLEQARAERKSLQAQYASLASGARNEEITSAKARTDVAQSALDLQDRRLERYRLESPVPGRVLEVHADVGEIVRAGSPIATVADVEHPLIEVFVPQDHLADIRVGAAAQLKVDTHDRLFSGKVTHIAARTEFTPRFIFSEEERPRLVIRVRVRVDDPEQLLHAGVPGFVRFER